MNRKSPIQTKFPSKPAGALPKPVVGINRPVLPKPQTAQAKLPAQAANKPEVPVRPVVASATGSIQVTAIGGVQALRARLANRIPNQPPAATKLNAKVVKTEPPNRKPGPIRPNNPVTVQRKGRPGVEAFQVSLQPKSGGMPLPEDVRAKMETALGADFSDVRIHVGREASSIGALAYTWGTNIHFAPGQYNPHSMQGQKILGHELWHVVQQKMGRVSNPLGGVAVVQDHALEAEADRMGVKAAMTNLVKRNAAQNSVQAKPASSASMKPIARPHKPQLVQGRLVLNPPRPVAQRKPMVPRTFQAPVLRRLTRPAIQFSLPANAVALRNFARAKSGVSFLRQGAVNSIQRQKSANCIQMNAAVDLPAAQTNLNWLVAEMAQLQNSGTTVYNTINGAAGGARKDAAAAGLRYYWERFIDTFDGKKAEMYEAESLANAGRLPILSSNDFNQPDVRYFTPGGNQIAIEVKAINSDTVSNVNTAINNADSQLAKRTADERRIKIRIESRNNLWPSAVHNHIGNIANNTDLRNWLTQPGIIPSIGTADEIQIEGINVPYGGVGATRNFRAEIKANGDVKKTGSQVW